jgi:hypothetical protein
MHIRHYVYCNLSCIMYQRLRRSLSGRSKIRNRHCQPRLSPLNSIDRPGVSPHAQPTNTKVLFVSSSTVVDMSQSASNIGSCDPVTRRISKLDEKHCLVENRPLIGSKRTDCA